MKLSELGVELYVFGEKRQTLASLEQILSHLRDAGYGTVEGILDLSSAPGLLKRSGLRLLGHHILTRQLQAPEAFVDQMRACQCEDVIVSGLLDWHVRTPAAYREAAALLEKAGAWLKSQGMRLTYHNHEFEFERVEGDRTGMDLLLEHTDSAHVGLCADVGWVWYAGVDSAAFLKQNAVRVQVIHLRDFNGKVSETLGRGKVPLVEQLAAIATLPNLRWLVVEQDPTCPDPIASMQESRDWLVRHWPWKEGV